MKSLFLNHFQTNQAIIFKFDTQILVVPIIIIDYTRIRLQGIETCDGYFFITIKRIKLYS